MLWDPGILVALADRVRCRDQNRMLLGIGYHLPPGIQGRNSVASQPRGTDSPLKLVSQSSSSFWQRRVSWYASSHMHDRVKVGFDSPG